MKILIAGLMLCASVLTSRALDGPVATQPQPDLSQITERLAAQLAPRLARARYMETNGQPVAVPGWEGFPTRQYLYSVMDTALHTNKTASVILLDPDAAQLARWIVNACLAAKGTVTANDLKKLTDEIIGQSGGQFPVRGIVYEDILPANGIHEIYCFMDGVTVKVNGVEHRSEVQPMPAQIEKSLTFTVNDVSWVGKYARIQSTTREDYQAGGGTEKVDGTNWLTVSRLSYQKAWHSPTNELMNAWAKAHL